MQHPLERGRAFVLKMHVLMVLFAITASGLLALYSWRAGLASLAGAFSMLLPQMFAAHRLLQTFGPQRAPLFRQMLMMYQSLKWVLMATLLALAYRTFRAEALYVFAGFVVLLQGLWIVPLILAQKGTR